VPQLCFDRFSEQQPGRAPAPEGRAGELSHLLEDPADLLEFWRRINDKEIRLISARKANRADRKTYEQERDT
jgi:uncharacterized DUF497 family protein